MTSLDKNSENYNRTFNLVTLREKIDTSRKEWGTKEIEPEKERIKEIVREELKRLEKLEIERIKRKKLELKRIEREIEEIPKQILNKRRIKKLAKNRNVELRKVVI